MFSDSFDAATDKVFTSCMTEKGFAMKPLPVRTDAQRDPTFNAVQRKLFDPQIAGTYGYRTASQVTGTPAQLFDAQKNQASGSVPDGAGAQDAWDTCMTESLKPFPTVPQEPLGQKLAASAADSALKTDAVKKAAARWHTCMEPLGISDLPETPVDFPSKSLQSVLGLEGADGAAVSAPGAQELQIARQDAQCQDSSGWRQTLYDAQWNAEVALLPANLSKLTAEKKSFDDREAAAQKILNAP